MLFDLALSCRSLTNLMLPTFRNVSIMLGAQAFKISAVLMHVFMCISLGQVLKLNEKQRQEIKTFVTNTYLQLYTLCTKLVSFRT